MDKTTIPTALFDELKIVLRRSPEYHSLQLLGMYEAALAAEKAKRQAKQTEDVVEDIDIGE